MTKELHISRFRELIDELSSEFTGELEIKVRLALITAYMAGMEKAKEVLDGGEDEGSNN